MHEQWERRDHWGDVTVMVADSKAACRTLADRRGQHREVAPFQRAGLFVNFNCHTTLVLSLYITIRALQSRCGRAGVLYRGANNCFGRGSGGVGGAGRRELSTYKVHTLQAGLFVDCGPSPVLGYIFISLACVTISSVLPLPASQYAACVRPLVSNT